MINHLPNIIILLILFNIASILAQTELPKAELISRITNAYPSFSPDGSKIAYMSNADGDFDVYVLYFTVKEQKLQQLTDAPGQDGMPVWSPDGRMLAFRSYRDGNSQIYVMDNDGGNQKNISNNKYNDEHPYWSSDGERILFCSDRTTLKNEKEKNIDIFQMDADGSNVKQITNTPEIETYASWSPDNKNIICRKILDDENWEVVVMNSDGTNVVNLTKNNGIDGWPVWSPDGKKIAYTSERQGNTRIFTMDLDGKNKKQITNDLKADDRQPWWNPNGKNLLFARYNWFKEQTWYETAEIYIIKVIED